MTSQPVNVFLVSLLVVSIATAASAQTAPPTGTEGQSPSSQTGTDVQSPTPESGTDGQSSTSQTGTDLQSPSSQTGTGMETPSAAAEGGNAAATPGTTGAETSPEEEEEPIDYARMISSIRNLAAENADYEALFPIGQEFIVNLVTLTELKGEAGENLEDLEGALGMQFARLDDLRAALERNADISDTLRPAGYEAENVVAVDNSLTGELTLVIDDPL